MKKILAIASVMALLTNCAVYAGTSVDWFAFWGFYPHGGDPTSLTPGTGVAASQAVIWQLIYTGTDNAIDLLDSANSAGGYVSDDDVVLATRNVPAGAAGYGDEWLGNLAGAQPLFTSGTTYVGSFYERVIGDITPAIGEWYYNSPKLTAVNWTSGDPDQLLDGNTDGANQGDALNVQIVPEPSSMALLAIGLGVVALRRMRRS